MTFKYSLLFIVFSLWVFSCGSDVATVPKPRAFPRIIFPEKGYTVFEEAYCDFSFEAPVSAQIVQDTSFFDEMPEHPCWFDIYYPTFDGRIHCSYRPINNENSFEVLMQDAFNMAGWHNKKANYIEEMLIQNDQGVEWFCF